MDCTHSNGNGLLLFGVGCLALDSFECLTKKKLFKNTKIPEMANLIIDIKEPSVLETSKAMQLQSVPAQYTADKLRAYLTDEVQASYDYLFAKVMHAVTNMPSVSTILEVLHLS
jgi:hypothetical protein